MKFGIMAPYLFVDVADGGYTTRFARMAESYGFESIWAVDHVVMCPDYRSRYPYAEDGRTPFHEDVVQPDPLTWLTWAAAATEHIRLATGILILPQRNPLVLAKSAASLDSLSGGRLLLGIGVGWVKEEAEALGTDFATRGRRCDEYIEAMRELWREPVASYSGEYVNFERVVSRPKPAQKGGVPILVGGHSPAAARRAGRLGDGFYPLGVMGDELAKLLDIMRSEAEGCGRDPGAIEVSAVGTLDLAVARAFADQGVDRVVVSPPTGDLAEVEDHLGRFREEVMGAFASD